MSLLSSEKPKVEQKRVKYVRQPSDQRKSVHSPPTSPLEVDSGPSSPQQPACNLIYTVQWPVEDPVAHVYILHGYAEHCERYEKFCQLLNENKISVATHDHIGHGLSHGDRFHVDHFDTFVHDALELIREHKRDVVKEAPFVLFGHSMGGLLATLCMLRDPALFTAGILSSPCLEIHPKYNKPSLRVVAKAIGWLAPKFYLPTKALALDPNDVIADETDRQSYETDPLIWHYGSKPGFTCAMFDAIKEAQDKLLTLKVRCLVQHGTHDLVCDPAAVEPFRKIPDIVTLKLYEGAKHALLMDKPEIKAVVIKDCMDFLKSVVEN